MTNSLEDEVKRIVASMDNEQNSQEQGIPETGIPGNETTEEIQDIYVLIVREHEEEEEIPQVVDSVPIIPQKISFMPAYAICSFYLFLIFSCIAFQLYMILNPPIATVTIIPKSQTVMLTGTLQLGRLLNPITLSQSQVTSTTGKGHQDARSATGFITFYNGQFQSVTIAAGTILTGADAIQIVTDQDAIIPPGNPPNYGQVTVSAHAINPGVRGNIPAYDISQACCSSAVLAKNPQPFTGGQDKRDFSTVSTKDIHMLSTSLKTAVMQSMSAALLSQLRSPEQLFILPCTPTVTSDHSIGAEATQVKVTVSQTCISVAYNNQELETKVTAFLTTQALHMTGAGYSLFGNVHVSMKQASVTNTPHTLVFLSFHASGTWIYGISQKAQEQIKRLIAGRTRQDAETLLSTLPGVEQAKISWGDDTRLPKNSGYIHISLFVV
jgi:hypothetical protein